MDYPCKNCTKRTPGCHSECEAYIMAKNEHPSGKLPEIVEYYYDVIPKKQKKAKQYYRKRDW